jgi:hypothetical protein
MSVNVVTQDLARHDTCTCNLNGHVAASHIHQLTPQREKQRTMPLLNLAAIGARRLRRRNSDESTSQLSSLPPTEDSLSAGSINSIDSFVYPEGDAFTDDENESYDPYLKPLMKERKIRLGNRLKNLPSFPNKSPVKASVGTPDTAYESISDSPTSMKASTKRTGRFRSFKPPSFLEVPTKFAPIRNEDSIIIHVEDEKPKVNPGLREREYWNKVANKTLHKNGIVHLRTAEALLQLGNSHMRCEVSMVAAAFVVIACDV